MLRAEVRGRKHGCQMNGFLLLADPETSSQEPDASGLQPVTYCSLTPET
jgi:hypothetical protein